jgi:peptidoglycan/LPS O-acetylase OafA/YrhL
MTASAQSAVAEDLQASVAMNRGSDEAPARAKSFDLQHKPWLDGWRGIAILAVLLGHLVLVPWMKPARFGVELFFVLSGRLMAELLFVNRQPLGYFLKRRVARVWPALYVYVLIMAVVFSGPGRYHVGTEQIVGALTYTFNYVRIGGGPVLPLDHLWSLCVEEWAYLFLALFALAARRWSLRASTLILAVALICAINGIIQTEMGGVYRDVYWRTDVRIASIFVACSLFLILRERSVPSYLPIVAGLLGTLFHTYFFPDVVKYTVGTLLLATSVATIDSAPRFAISVLSSRPLTMMGLWSYSIYLWQQPFTKVIRHSPLPLKLGLVMVAALTSFYFVERPARRYLKRVWADRSLRKGKVEPEIVAGGPAL